MAEYSVDHRYHLYPNLAGLGVSGGYRRFLPAQDGRLFDEADAGRVDALIKAEWHHRPKNRVPVHPDQGSHQGSDDRLRSLKSSNLEPGMSCRGNCWDNALAESFFNSLKKERINRHTKTHDLAQVWL